MASTKVQEQPRPVAILMNPTELLRVALIGAVIGLIAVALYGLLDKYVFTPALCEGTTMTVGRCASKPVFVNALSMILAAIVGLFGMVQIRAYRPLLIVILVSVGVWGILSILIVGLPWWGAALGGAMVFGLVYALFAWLVQLRHFLLAICISCIAVVIVRLLLLS